jgi:hypothetical protein
MLLLMKLDGQHLIEEFVGMVIRFLLILFNHIHQVIPAGCLRKINRDALLKEPHVPVVASEPHIPDLRGGLVQVMHNEETVDDLHLHQLARTVEGLQ